MRAMALLMITTILVVPLAGCVDNGDGPQFELSAEDIEQLIDNNMEEFLNNTSITLNQNVNYYNNSSVQQPSILKSTSGTIAGNEYSILSAGSPALLIREDAFSAAAAGNSAEGLDGANICVGVGTITEEKLLDWFNSLNITFTSVGTADAAEATDKLIAGECDAFVGDWSSLVAKKAALDNDGSIAGGTWMDSRYTPSEYNPGEVGSSISIVISQSSNEMLTGIEYLFTQVTLSAICNGNDSSCEDIIQILSHDSLSTTMDTICSHNVSSSWEVHPLGFGSLTPFFGPHGLDCTHTLNLNAINQIEGVDGYDSTNHDLSWSDWTYSIIWESIPIES
tara:strand:- start:176 stop:1186 length:1011 start_codon:yes stop_codon:yes gene_type:complete